MQIVTSTFCFLASASAAATMVLIAARFKYFRVGRSADDGAATEDAVATRLSIITSSLNMRRMLPQRKSSRAEQGIRKANRLRSRRTLRPACVPEHGDARQR